MWMLDYQGSSVLQCWIAGMSDYQDSTAAHSVLDVGLSRSKLKYTEWWMSDYQGLAVVHKMLDVRLSRSN